MLPVIKNAKGEPIVLNTREQLRCDHLQRIANSLGYEISITTLTTILKKISEQKFFQVAPADYLPVVVGEGAWSSNLVAYRSFAMSDQFETGLINVGGENSRLATADAGVDSVSIQVYNWAKTLGWTIPEMELAAKAGNWDIVSAKEEARKKDWDLGIQRIAFLGARGLNSAGGACLGLLNQTGITVNTTIITKAIKSMTSTELNALCQALVEAYRANCNRTAWPTHFVIPESDYNGLASQVSDSFPIKTKLELLEQMLKTVCRNPSFKVLPLAYADSAYSGFSYQQYALYNYDEKSLRMSVPVDYTNTLANSLDNFSFQNVAYGQFSGVMTLRPLECLYLQYT